MEKAKIKRLGGYDKLYRIKLEGDYLAKLAFDGAKRIYGEPLTEEVKERMNFELYIMKTMGFPGYFLIVQDFINAARKELGVSVGPGRGSAPVRRWPTVWVSQRSTLSSTTYCSSVS